MHGHTWHAGDKQLTGKNKSFPNASHPTGDFMNSFGICFGIPVHSAECMYNVCLYLVKFQKEALVS